MCTHTHYLFNILWIKPKVQRFQYSRHTVANQVVLGTTQAGLEGSSPLPLVSWAPLDWYSETYGKYDYY